MGCGASTPSDDDGAAYRAEVIAYDAADAAAGGGAHDGGRADVAEKIAEIKASVGRTDKALAAIKKNKGVPPPGSELAKHAAEEACNAVGALFTIASNLQTQIDEMYARKASREAVAELVQENAEANRLLLAARNLYQAWKLEMPAKALAMAQPEAFAKLKVANSPDGTTMQQVIGAMVLEAEAKRERPEDGGGGSGGGGNGGEEMAAASTAITLPSGKVRHGVWDHGEIATEEEAAKRVVAGGESSGCFLISTRPKGFKGEEGGVGEFWLSIRSAQIRSGDFGEDSDQLFGFDAVDPDPDLSSQIRSGDFGEDSDQLFGFDAVDPDPDLSSGGVQHFPITTDPKTKMLLVPKDSSKPLEQVNSYDGATTLHELVAALSKPGRGDLHTGDLNSECHQLKHPVPFPESYGEWDHGEIATEEAAKRVVTGGESGCFLISTRPKGHISSHGLRVRRTTNPAHRRSDFGFGDFEVDPDLSSGVHQGGVGEFWLSIKLTGQGGPMTPRGGSLDVCHFPITTDPKTKMLLVPRHPHTPLKKVNSYDGATTLHALVAALSKPNRDYGDDGDWDSDDYQLKHPVPSPESKIGGTVENPKQFASLMTIYAAARTAISGPLVRALVKDLSEYDNAAAKHTALAGPAVMARLAAAATPEASASMQMTAAQKAEMTFDKKAPPPTSLHFIVYSQRKAADVSIKVYHIACDMIDAVVGGGDGEGAAAAKGAYCIPGGVKGDRRILFKSLFKYGGIFSNCRDLSRLTICVLNLTAAAILAESIHKHPLLLVIRCKNRFAASANTTDSGGYRDFQMLCLYKRGGCHYYVEIQINLVEMVDIKEGKGGGGGGGDGKKKEATDNDDAMAGGHDAFNTARVIDAFSKRSIEYSGDPSDALWKMIAAGSLIRVVLDKATMTDAQVTQLAEAMASDQCRVRELSMLGCGKGITTIPVGLMVHIGSSQRKSTPDVLDLSEWEDLRELPDSLGKLTHLKTLKLEYCENLETLPETGVAGLVNLEELNLSHCKKLKQLPQSIAKLTKLKTLNLYDCRNLAEPLPDLSHLLPGLEIKGVEGASDAVKAWKKRGFTSLANFITACTGDTLNLHGACVESLPDSLGKLSHLKTLKLEKCRNLETLPETGVAGLVNLKELDLSHCEKLKQLPQSIAKLTKLKTLGLASCENLETLPETGVAGLVNLEELDLGTCYKLKQLPQSIAKLTKLKTLDLYECKTLAEPLPDLSHLLPGLKIKGVEGASDAVKAWKKRGFTSLANFITACTGDTLNLHGACVESLPDSLGKLSHLKTLKLEYCENLETLPETGVAGLVNLEELNLSHCKKLKQLPQSIAKLTKLKTLNLYDCRNLETLPETGVAGLVSLEELDLSGCSKLKQLPQSIAKLAKLKTLNLYECGSLETLPETGVAGLVNLEELDLGTCYKLKQLPQSIAKLTKLKTLDLYECKTLAEPLPDLSHLLPGLKIKRVYSASDAAKAWGKRGFTSLANRSKIMKMLADGTLHTYVDDVLNLTNSKIETLPDSLGKLSHLKTLKLEYCENLETLPETGVAGLVNLEELNLSHCKKLKQLPQSIAKLTKLKTLNLYDCRNLETLPETGVAGLVSLEELDLSHCEKLKQLPQSIAKLTKLKTLGLASCENLETLPETGVAGLVNLEELDLGTCYKLKQLPQSIAKLTKLKTLDLYECKTLAEPLPDLSHLLPGLKIKRVYSASDAAKAWGKRGFTSLANRSKIMKMLADGTLHTYVDDVLNLTNSKIETLPNSLGKLTHLKTLKLESCANLETLPETGVAGLVNLEVLDLRLCSKLKQLPQSIAKLAKLKTLSLYECGSLETLPETGVAGLVSLEELDLSGCSKLKQLPQSIAKLAKLKTLNLDGCRNLAQPLPDLSHLLPGLKIDARGSASDAAKAWEERGFTSWAKALKMIADGTYTKDVVNLGGSDIETLPDSLGELAHLKTLNLQSCANLETLPETGVAGLVNLEELDLSWCSELKQLPQSIAKLTKLKTLNLELCENLETLPETGVAGLVNLEELDLSVCSKLKQLPQSIAKLTKLKKLDLGGCKNLEMLPETGVAGLDNLEVLNLQSCTELKQLPQSMAKLTKLKTLDVMSCSNLAEPLPDLSHLLPGLKINYADRASGAAKAWQKRGFTSLDN